MAKITLALCTLLLPLCVNAQDQPVNLTVAYDKPGPELPARFLGLSYESSTLLPRGSRHYFDAHDDNIVRLFKTLGIRSLRVGARAVDDPRVTVPQEADIDSLFAFARAAGVKVIYSFRLENGDPAVSGRLAKYIADHYSDALDCFSIGNEPNLYIKTYAEYLSDWKPHYDAILQAVPSATFDAPSVAGRPDFVLDMARDLFPAGKMAMLSNHQYFFGESRARELNPEATRAAFLSNSAEKIYERDYAQVGALLEAQNIPYRLDELNSCFHGGAKNASDTYASALWCLDCTHWWAAHHILGMNYHSGEFVRNDGGFAGFNYTCFIHMPDGQSFDVRPISAGLVAFSQGAHGGSVPVEVQTDPAFDVTAYAYKDGASFYLTVINKTHGVGAKAADVIVPIQKEMDAGRWVRMDLDQKYNDAAAKTDVEIGGAVVDPQGNWAGQWQPFQTSKPGELRFQVPACSAAIVRCSPSPDGPETGGPR